MALSRRTIIVILIFALSLALISIFFYIIYLINNSQHGLVDGAINKHNQLIKGCLISFATLLGIVSRIIYNKINTIKEESINIITILFESLKSKEFWIAILISPIIIGAFLKTLDSINSYPLLMLISYENGFFFKTIFEKKDI